MESSTAQDDAIEDISGNDQYPGQLLLVSNVDTDQDGILDWVDGFDLCYPAIPQDDVSAGTTFAHLVVSIPSWVDPATATVELLYDDTDPAQYLDLGDEELGRHFERPHDGSLRIWKRDSFQPARRLPRNCRRRRFYCSRARTRRSSLGMTSSTTTFYLEAVNPSQLTASQTIKIRVSGGGLPAGLVFEDQVLRDQHFDPDHCQ